MMLNFPMRYCRVTVIKYEKKKEIFRAEFENKNSIGYRIDFNIVKLQSNVLNTAQIQIYNLTNDTSDFLSGGDRVIIEAGNTDKNGVIYAGNIASKTVEKNGVDIITTLMCSQMGTWTKSVVRKTVNRQPLGLLIDEIANDAGIKISRPSMVEDVISKTYFGDIRSILKKMGTAYNFTHEINDGTLIIKYNKESVVPDVKFKYDPSSGLLRTPTITEKGVDIKVMLEPFIQPNNRFELEARFANFNLGAMEFVERVRGRQLATSLTRNVNTERFHGSFSVMQLVHEGSTHDNVWQTSIEGMYPRAIQS